jgi:hypoxanthine phosphoribosyltransferase
MDKRYINASELLEDSFRLAVKIRSSGFIPDLLVAIWRGGTPVGIAVHEYFKYMGNNPDHICIRAASYTGINQRNKTVEITGLDYIYQHLSESQRLLIVDDVFDTGNSIKTLVSHLEKHFSKDIHDRTRIACPWYKPANNQTDLVPDYYLHETRAWLVFPHELVGLEEAELRAGKPAVHEIIS